MRLNNGQPWSEDETALLTSLVRQGFSALMIANEMGRSPEAINNRIYRLGMATPRSPGAGKRARQISEWSPTELRKLDELVSSGMSIRLIAAKLNRTQAAVKDAVAKLRGVYRPFQGNAAKRASGI